MFKIILNMKFKMQRGAKMMDVIDLNEFFIN